MFPPAPVQEGDPLDRLLEGGAGVTALALFGFWCSEGRKTPSTAAERHAN